VVIEQMAPALQSNQTAQRTGLPATGAGDDCQAIDEWKPNRRDLTSRLNSHQVWTKNRPASSRGRTVGAIPGPVLVAEVEAEARFSEHDWRDQRSGSTHKHLWV